MKLTLVSVTFRGITNSFFINLPMINGKAVCSYETIQSKLADIGCDRRGLTFSIS